MRTRTEITEALAKRREALLARYRSFTPEELERVCTQSEAPDGSPWRPKDHLAHLADIERAFQWMAKRAMAGHPDPTGFSKINGGERSSVLAYIHDRNEKNVHEHLSDDLEALFANLAAARAATLALLATTTDEQLALPAPGAPWDDGTVGGLLITTAHHDQQHLAWVEEGLRTSEPSA